MCTSCGPFSLIFGVVGFLLWILALFWVYSDAEANGYSGCLWFVIVWFFGFLGLAAYLIFFHGVSAPRRHRATSRNEDFTYRAMYRSPSKSSARSGLMPNTWGDSPQTSTATAESDFQDEELERLISAGKLSEARAYLKDMQSIAREMNDAKGLANYRQYEAKISRAASQRGGRLSNGGL